MADIYYGEYVKLRMKASKAADNNRFQVNNSLWTLNNGPKWFLHGFDRDKPDLLLSPNVNENKGMQSN
ncbi:MAG TPA: hypothetical protein ENK88_09060, partial [Campylobacterales bacterium]|nr:hypothetical protein [Campylobacterales bacterium]